MMYLASLLFYILGLVEFVLRVLAAIFTVFMIVIVLEEKTFDCIAWNLAQQCLK